MTTADAKLRLRVDHADEDALIADLVAAATEHVERVTQRLLAARECVLRLPGFPGDGRDIELPGGRVASVTSVVWRDADGVSATLDAGRYEVQGHSPARLALTDADGWPTAGTVGLPVTVTYVAGWEAVSGDYGANVPEALRTAVAMIAGEMFEQRREALVGVSQAAASVGAQALMGPWRIRAIG